VRSPVAIVRWTVTVFALAGCSTTVQVPTDRNALDIDSSRVGHLRASQSVALKNAYPGETTARLTIGKQTWVFDEYQLTDTGIAMLRRALEKRGMTPPRDKETAAKALELRVRVTGAQARSFVVAAQALARVEVTANFGDGGTATVEAVNSSTSGGLQSTYDGAVLIALNNLVADQRFVAYMNR